MPLRQGRLSHVGRTVLQPYSDPSKYRFTKEAYPSVREKVEDVDGEE